MRICVFCGARGGSRVEYAEAARRLARELTVRAIGLVYGGSAVGLMGTLADEMVAVGGEAVGVIPRPLVRREAAHGGLSRLHIVESLAERKARMVELADGFVALPGGLGTLDELFEVLSWSQLGLHGKPCGLLNVAGYFDSLLAFLDRAVAEGLVAAEHRSALWVETQPEALVARIARRWEEGGGRS